MNRFSRLVALVVALLAISSCGGPMPPQRNLTVVATEMAFTPNRLEAKVGDQIFLTFDNKGKLDHNLVINFAYGTRVISSQAGVSAVLAFPAREAGTFTFYCDLPGHAAQRGVLVVAP